MPSENEKVACVLCLCEFNNKDCNTFTAYEDDDNFGPCCERCFDKLVNATLTAENERLKKAWDAFAKTVGVPSDRPNFQHHVIAKAKALTAENEKLREVLRISRNIICQDYCSEVPHPTKAQHCLSCIKSTAALASKRDSNE